jgi:hypothetical protein
MIDSVCLWIESSSTERAINNLSNVKEIADCSTGEILHTGYLKNLRVRATGCGASVIGSLAKFHLGNNYQTLTRQTTEEAIQELSDALSLPVERARVYRLEVGSCLVMRRPVGQYWSFLGSSGRYERVEYKHGLLYKNSRRALTFYDKAKDLKRHKEPIPEIINGRNLLRYEVKLNKRVADQLGKREVLAGSLYEEDFYIKLLGRWEAEYFLINKINRPRLVSVELMKSVQQFNRYLAVVGLRALGEQEVLAMLEQCKESLSKLQRSRLRDRIRELTNAKNLTEADESILELDSKIKQAAQFYR